MNALFLAILLAAPSSAKEAGHVQATLLVSGSEAALRLIHEPHWIPIGSTPATQAWRQS